MTTPTSAAERLHGIANTQFGLTQDQRDFLRSIAAELERGGRAEAALTVTKGGGVLTGTLPCGHDAKGLDVEVRGAVRIPYCPACWNEEPAPPRAEGVEETLAAPIVREPTTGDPLPGPPTTTGTPPGRPPVSEAAAAQGAERCGGGCTQLLRHAGYCTYPPTPSADAGGEAEAAARRVERMWHTSGGNVRDYQETADFIRALARELEEEKERADDAVLTSTRWVDRHAAAERRLADARLELEEERAVLETLRADFVEARAELKGARLALGKQYHELMLGVRDLRSAREQRDELSVITLTQKDALVRMRSLADSAEQSRVDSMSRIERLDERLEAAERERDGLRLLIAPDANSDARTDYASIMEIMRDQAADQERAAFENVKLRTRVAELEDINLGWRLSWGAVARAAGEREDIMTTSLRGRVEALKERSDQLAAAEERERELRETVRLVQRDLDAWRSTPGGRGVQASWFILLAGDTIAALSAGRGEETSS